MAFVGPVPTGTIDPVLYQDRALSNLLAHETSFVTSTACYGTVQTEVTLGMRVILGTWMRSVARAHQADASVFPLAVSILDRYLECRSIPRRRFQRLGAACLFLAGKIRDLNPFKAAFLCFCAADDFSVADLLKQEKSVLKALRWKLEAVLPTDAIGPALFKSGFTKEQLFALHSRVVESVHKAIVNPVTGGLSPSLVAAACALFSLGAAAPPLDKLAEAIGVSAATLTAAAESVATTLRELDEDRILNNARGSS
ncbi:JM152 [macacine gammaherpesvirus 11]|uniref:JM152 n=2 Tax=macacine gammaherpesvirus 11 TaxID=2560570 RepID=G9JMF9_9GAMA|nr:JM152 [Macaca fuscata rhadinovirus]AAT00129.1 JM152 [Macaca fuscata rhadinovirus]AEW87676.1 JM152 [Macaca fuscata rhadinovirus]AEW87846.1 JM152 [Macaca fuscata rhadinovirus]